MSYVEYLILKKKLVYYIQGHLDFISSINKRKPVSELKLAKNYDAQ